MREILETAIAENPEDAAAHAAYADWLAERGDPRGDFIRIQLALEDEALDRGRRAALRVEEQRLLALHGRAWLGPELAGVVYPHWFRRSRAEAEFGFRRGWLDRLHFPVLDQRIATTLVRSPATRFLRSLSCDVTASEGEWAEMAGAAFVPRLRTLRIGNDPMYSAGLADGITDFLATARDLESLELMAHEVDTAALFGLELGRLRVLAVHCLNDYRTERLAGNSSLVNLERIAFHPRALHPEDSTAYLRLTHLQSITRSRFLGSLRHFEFHVSDVGDDGCRELVDSGLLGRLRHLSLAFGSITDVGARLLCDSGQMAQLQTINLTGNAITGQGRARLEATGVTLLADEQHPVDDNDYLFTGDWE